MGRGTTRSGKIASDSIELERLIVRLMADSSQYDKVMDQADDKIVNTAKKLTGAGTRLTLAVSTPLLALGGGFVHAASEAEETLGKFETVFNQVSEQAAAATKTLDDEFGLSENQARRMLADTGDMLAGFGFAQEGALDLSNQVQQLSVDLASFQNLEGGAERASRALTAGLLGERESMKALGIAILEEDVKARVLLNSQKGLTFETERQAKAVATLMLAQEQSANSMGDYARTQMSFANQTRELKADLADLSVEFGKILLPQAKQMLSVTRGLVSWLRGLDTETKTYIVTAAKFAAALGPVLVALGTFGFLSAHVATSLKTLLAVSRTLFAFMKIGTLAMLAPWLPLLGIIAAVTAAVAGLAYLIVGPEGLATAWGSVKDAAMTAFNFIKSFMANFSKNMGIVISWLKDNWWELAKGLGAAFVTLFQNMAHNAGVGVKTLFRLFTAFSGWMRGRFEALLEYIFSGEFSRQVAAGFGKLIEMAIPAVNYLQELFGAAVGNIVSFFTTLPGIVLPVVTGVAVEMANIFTKAANVISKAIAAALRGEIPNPAELAADLAKSLPGAISRIQTTAADAVVKAGAAAQEKFNAVAAGLAEKYSDVFDQAEKDFNAGFDNSNFFETAAGIIGEGIDELKNPLEGFKDLGVELPKFDLEINKAADSMDAVASNTSAAVEQANRLGAAYKQAGLEAALVGSEQGNILFERQRQLLIEKPELFAKGGGADDVKRNDKKKVDLLEQIAINTAGARNPSTTSVKLVPANLQGLA